MIDYNKPLNALSDKEEIIPILIFLMKHELLPCMWALPNCTDRLVLPGNRQSLGNMQITVVFDEENENIQKITDILAITTNSNFYWKMIPVDIGIQPYPYILQSGYFKNFIKCKGNNFLYEKEASKLYQKRLRHWYFPEGFSPLQNIQNIC